MTTLIGASPNEDDVYKTGLQNASRGEVLRHLWSGEYELVHYAGHCDYDQSRPDEAGWRFMDGYINSRVLENEIPRRVPVLVFANACVSGQLSKDSGGTFLASLADAFFRIGVHNYIGTRWSVPDEPARTFAKRFYKALLGRSENGGGGSSIGMAILEARRELYGLTNSHGSSWLAYQHYGDPALTIETTA